MKNILHFFTKYKNEWKGIQFSMIKRNSLKYFIGYNDDGVFRPLHIYKASSNDWLC